MIGSDLILDKIVEHIPLLILTVVDYIYRMKVKLSLVEWIQFQLVLDMIPFFYGYGLFMYQFLYEIEPFSTAIISGISGSIMMFYQVRRDVATYVFYEKLEELRTVSSLKGIEK